MEWLPIESAPRDGTPFLAGKGKRMMVINWPLNHSRGTTPAVPACEKCGAHPKQKFGPTMEMEDQINPDARSNIFDGITTR